jgi:hypothetical protein
MNMVPTGKRIDSGKVNRDRIIDITRLSSYEVKKTLGLPVSSSDETRGEGEKRYPILGPTKKRTKNLSKADFQERFKKCTNTLDFILLHKELSNNKVWADIVLRAWEKASGDQIAKAHSLKKAKEAFNCAPPSKHTPALINWIGLIEKTRDFFPPDSIIDAVIGTPMLSLARQLLILKAASLLS